MDAILLVDWHLVFFEVEVGDTLLQDANQEIVGKLVLVGESSARDGFKPGEEGLIRLVVLGDGVERAVGELVVVAVVSEGGSALGKIAEIGLVLLFKKSVLSGEAVGDWLGILGKNGADYGDDEKQARVMAHRCMQGSRAKGGCANRECLVAGNASPPSTPFPGASDVVLMRLTKLNRWVISMEVPKG